MFEHGIPDAVRQGVINRAAFGADLPTGRQAQGSAPTINIPYDFTENKAKSVVLGKRFLWVV